MRDPGRRDRGGAAFIAVTTLPMVTSGVPVVKAASPATWATSIEAAASAFTAAWYEATPVAPSPGGAVPAAMSAMAGETPSGCPVASRRERITTAA